MTPSDLPLIAADVSLAPEGTEPVSGFGALRTATGNLPLEQLTMRAVIVGLVGETRLVQRFRNPHSAPIEATYIFPLPDRGAVTAVRMTSKDRTVVASLRERGEARDQYDAAIAQGHQASIAEEERPDVFSLRVGNILPGERLTVELTVAAAVEVADARAVFRFPLVVAPRYVPGRPLPGESVGLGHASDTDIVPDASRISPPVLLPGFPHPVGLDLEVRWDPAGLVLGSPECSLPATTDDEGSIRVSPGARADRDLVVRRSLEPTTAAAGLVLIPDPEPVGDSVGAEPDPSSSTGTNGTFELTVIPPEPPADRLGRDVVLLVDRSGSMTGWKMVAARRAAADIIDSLTARDRFAVLAFDDRLETVDDQPPVLSHGGSRERFRATEFLDRLQARGGTELSAPLAQAVRLLAPASDAAAPTSPGVVVLITDGQVANEDDLVRRHANELERLRVHAVGIDRAVNIGLLARLTSLGGGRCELVESQEHLVTAMEHIQRRILEPSVIALELDADGLEVVPASLTPARLPDVFPGVPFVVRGRYRGSAEGAVILRGTRPGGEPWQVISSGSTRTAPAVTALWARGHLRDLEDRYTAVTGPWSGAGGAGPDPEALERELVRTSLTHGVLCRFTAFVAVDDRVVTDTNAPRQIVQPVELPAGWSPPAPAPMMLAAPVAAGAPGAARTRGAGSFVRPAPVLSRAAGVAPAPVRRTNPAVEILAVEVRRLRRLVGASDLVRREALLDLASRLAALDEARISTAPGWRAVLDRLEDADSLERVWEQILSLLEQFLAEPPESNPSGRLFASFWKRQRP